MKFPKSTLVLLIFVALMNGAIAQLSGPYTIGGAGPSYSTIQAAVTDLQAVGVSGAVVFNIRAGTYNEKILLGGNITGSSAINTITFKAENGDSSSVIISDTSSANASNNFTWLINNGTDYVIIRNLTIERTGTLANSTVLYVGGGTKFFQLRNCVIRADVSTNTAATKNLVTFPLALSGDSSAIFANNLFIGGSIAVSINGQSQANPVPLVQFTNNVFQNHSSRAISIANSSSVTISGNTISTLASTNFRGVSLTHALHNFTVTGNKITGTYAGDALYLDSCNGDVGNEALIANNFFQAQGTGTSRGITVNQSTSMHIYYNTINVTTTGTGVNNAAFRLINAGNTLLNVRNNIFVNTGGGLAYSFPAGTLGNFSALNYNDLFVGPNSATLVRLDVNNYATIADWKTASLLEAQSVSGDPHFVSSSDLHVDNAIVNNNAIVISGITTDIDGQLRSGTTPDIGADEFTPLLNNLGLTSIISPTSGACGDSATRVGVIINNFGLTSQSGFSVKADITGSINQTLTQVYSGSITTNMSDTIYFLTTLNTYAGATFDIVAYTSLVSDQYHANDTMRGSYTFFGHPNAPTAVSPQQYCDNNVMITATPDSGDALAWFDQAAGGNLLYTGSVFSPAINGDTTFYVEARTGSGTAGCLRITEIMPDDNPSDFIEIQNVSGGLLDATGWVVAASLDNTNINNVNANLWQLSQFAPGQVRFKTDATADTNYWGSNLLWTGGNNSWAMIVDNFGNIVDFVAWDYPADSILNMHPVVNGFTINVGSEWAGPGYTSCSASSNVRIGNTDHNDASDWACEPISPGVQNAGISSIFMNCGIGACGSPRIPVDVTIVPAPSVNLGNDIMIGTPFLVTLDAGSGFSSYLWSTGATTQTIDVSTYDTYWVTITNGTNNCSSTDSIVVSLNVEVNTLIGANEISFYPNPSKDKLVITGNDDLLKNSAFSITDIRGREVNGVQFVRAASGDLNVDISSMNNGIYFLQIVSGNRSGIQKFVVLK